MVHKILSIFVFGCGFGRCSVRLLAQLERFISLVKMLELLYLHELLVLDCVASVRSEPYPSKTLLFLRRVPSITHDDLITGDDGEHTERILEIQRSGRR